MGLLWASKFAQAGIRCTVLQRPANSVSNSNQSNDQNPSSILFQAYDKNSAVEIDADYKPLDQLPKKKIDFLIITTKAYDIVEATDSVIPYLGLNATLIYLSNGIGAQQKVEEQLKNYSSTMTIYWALSSDGAKKSMLKDNIHIRQTGVGTTYIGKLTNQKAAAGNNGLEILKQLDLAINFVDSIAHEIWKKFFINCAINPLTAYYDCKNGELLSDPIYHQHFESIVAELELIARKIDMETLIHPQRELSQSPQKLMIKQAATEVIEKTAENHSSMCMDFRQQRRNELDFLNGYLVQLAKEIEINLPHNQALVTELKARSPSF